MRPNLACFLSVDILKIVTSNVNIESINIKGTAGLWQIINMRNNKNTEMRYNREQKKREPVLQKLYAPLFLTGRPLWILEIKCGSLARESKHTVWNRSRRFHWQTAGRPVSSIQDMTKITTNVFCSTRKCWIHSPRRRCQIVTKFLVKIHVHTRAY